LLRAAPSRPDYRQELARTRYNRGILVATTAAPRSPETATAESDFREAISLLEPLASDRANRVPTLELARVYNNLATLLDQNDRVDEAQRLYEAAIRSDEELMKADPANREYMLELAKFCNNLSDLLRRLGSGDLARARSQQALDLLDALALPAPSLGIEQADAHNLRGQLLQATDARAALAAYQEAVEIFEKLSKIHTSRFSAVFHQRYDDLLLSLANLGKESRDAAVHALLVRAVKGYLDMGHASLTSGFVADAQLALGNVSSLLPDLSEPDRAGVMKSYRTLQDDVAARK
jgi:tetratricopeptide (TPR) repeat protein